MLDVILACTADASSFCTIYASFNSHSLALSDFKIDDCMYLSFESHISQDVYYLCYNAFSQADCKSRIRTSDNKHSGRPVAAGGLTLGDADVGGRQHRG